MSGSMVMWMGGGGGPTIFGGAISAFRFGASAASVTASLNTDGSLSASGSGDTVNVSQVNGDSWYAPPTTGIGSSFYVRATLSSGSAPSSGSGTGTWLALSSARSWTYNSGTGGAVSSRSGTLLIEVSPSATGTPVVCSGSISFDAERES